MRSLLLFLSFASVALAEPKLVPIDEGAQEKGFAEFRNKLNGAVKQRDAAYLASVLSTDVVSSFGEDRGLAAFERTYGFRDAAAPFWREMDAVLALGGTFSRDRKQFTAPYVFSRWPDELEAMEHTAIIAGDVPVYARPNETKELTRLSPSIVELAPDNDVAAADGEWVALRLRGLGIGFVRASATRSPLNYRAIFRRERGGWKLATFVAGD
ncbi:MAG TPA: hypothetical protein VF551_00375 [Chthoniobacterales bacterium]